MWRLPPPTLKELENTLEETRVALEDFAKKIQDALDILKNKTDWELVNHIDYLNKLQNEHDELKKKHDLIQKKIDKPDIYHEYLRARYRCADTKELQSQINCRINWIYGKLNELNYKRLDKEAKLLSRQEEKTDANDEKNRWGPLYIKELEDKLAIIEQETQKFLLQKKDNEDDLKKIEVEETANNAALYELAMRLRDLYK
jgi:hypothetical protein